jgi:hypothetical protein
MSRISGTRLAERHRPLLLSAWFGRSRCPGVALRYRALVAEDEKVIAESRKDLLLRLAEAEEAYRPKREGFKVIRAMGMAGVEVYHPALPHGLAAPASADLEDLADEGFIRARHGEHGISGFDITQAGLEQARLLQLAAATQNPGGAADGHALEWHDRVLPVLEAIGVIYGQADPALGLSMDALANELGVGWTTTTSAVSFTSSRRRAISGRRSRSTSCWRHATFDSRRRAEGRGGLAYGSRT